MAHQQTDNDGLDDDMDDVENDTELDSFLDKMATKNEAQNAEIIARQKIEDLLEEGLRSLIDDYYENNDDK